MAHLTFWMGAVALIGLRASALVGQPGYQVDADVYLRGASALLSGENLYAVSVHGLLFTYSPFGAAVFTPMVGLPTDVARGALLVLSLGALVLSLGIVAWRLRLRPVVAVSILFATGLSEPFYRGVLLGQVNMVLMALVVVDLLLLPKGRQGLLVGLAAGIKIVPGIFVVYFLLRRDWRGVLLSVVGFIASVGVGAAFDPGASRWYWSGGLVALGKFGREGVFASDNQSLSAFTDRVLHDPSLPTVVSVLGCLGGVVLATLAARRALGRRDDVGAVLALAMGGLLASPVSWTHHWIWVALVAALLASRRRWVAFWVTGIVFIVGPMWLVPHGSLSELRHDWWQTAVSGAYTLTGLVVLVGLGWWWSDRAIGPMTDEWRPSRG